MALANLDLNTPTKYIANRTLQMHQITKILQLTSFTLLYYEQTSQSLLWGYSGVNVAEISPILISSLLAVSAPCKHHHGAAIELPFKLVRLR